jgi:hypothetical protein
LTFFLENSVARRFGFRKLVWNGCIVFCPIRNGLLQCPRIFYFICLEWRKNSWLAASRETGIELVCIEDEALADGGHC